MLYILCVWILWRLVKMASRPRPTYYLPIIDHDDPPELPAPDYAAQAEAERLDALRTEYIAVLDAIEAEQAALRDEYATAGARRRSTIAARLTTLQSKRAATTRTITALDAKLCKIYDQKQGGQKLCGKL